MTLDLNTAKPGTTFQTRSVGTAEYLGYYPDNKFYWRLNIPGNTTYSTDSTGRLFHDSLSALDILHPVPSARKEL